ncbi:MAG: hypothetical protein WEC33_05985 [Dehalococcoidia bacterium]
MNSPGDDPNQFRAKERRRRIKCFSCGTGLADRPPPFLGEADDQLRFAPGWVRDTKGVHYLPARKEEQSRFGRSMAGRRPERLPASGEVWPRGVYNSAKSPVKIRCPGCKLAQWWIAAATA